MAPGAAVPSVTLGAAVPSVTLGAAVPSITLGAAVPSISLGAAVPSVTLGAVVPSAWRRLLRRHPPGTVRLGAIHPRRRPSLFRPPRCRTLWGSLLCLHSLPLFAFFVF